MKLRRDCPNARAARTALPLAALALLAPGRAAPRRPPTAGAKSDDKSGTLRVWLFQEVSNGPKQQVVDKAVAAFKQAHQGADVQVEYIPVDTRAQKIKAAFNDPGSAPDLIEYGNTDTAGYVKDGGLADVSAEFAAWPEAKDTDPTAKQSVTVGGKIYGAPLFVGVRALYYRTDILKDLGLAVPKTQDELIATAKKIHQAKPDLYGLAVGGAYTYGALPFLWANGGELATENGGKYTSALDSAAARKGIAAYTSLFGDDNCPAAKCAQMGGNATVTAFANGKAAMAIGGDFNHAAVEAGTVKGKYAVVPLPGLTPGSVAPAFAGRQQHRRTEEQFAPHARGRPHGAAHRQGHPARDVRRDGLPADVHRRTGRRREEAAVRRAVRAHPGRRAPSSFPRRPVGARSTPRSCCPRCSRRSSAARRTSRRRRRTRRRR